MQGVAVRKCETIEEVTTINDNDTEEMLSKRVLINKKCSLWECSFVLVFKYYISYHQAKMYVHDGDPCEIVMININFASEQV